MSQTAGTFVCNHVMYGLLHQLQENADRRAVLSIFRICLNRRRPTGQASMSVATVRAALETAIAVALEQDDDVKIGGATINRRMTVCRKVGDPPCGG